MPAGAGPLPTTRRVSFRSSSAMTGSLADKRPCRPQMTYTGVQVPLGHDVSTGLGGACPDKRNQGGHRTDDRALS